MPLNTESYGSIKYFSERQRISNEALIISALHTLHTPQTQLAREVNYVFARDTKNDTTSQDREKLKKKTLELNKISFIVSSFAVVSL